MVQFFLGLMIVTFSVAIIAGILLVMAIACYENKVQLKAVYRWIRGGFKDVEETND